MMMRRRMMMKIKIILLRTAPEDGCLASIRARHILCSPSKMEEGLQDLQLTWFLNVAG